MERDEYLQNNGKDVVSEKIPKMEDALHVYYTNAQQLNLKVMLLC